MIISIDNSQQELKNRLVKLGYTVHNISDNVASDVYIYSEEKNSLVNLSQSIAPVQEGSLIINAHGRSIDEILYSINRRVYSPLF